ncbi:MAG: hypothetical protein LQ342_006971 [Letrouitia transgressa]|nr:MAG: hypothetical protein LQ342_006971 [Letrouitia transgressa]
MVNGASTWPTRQPAGSERIRERKPNFIAYKYSPSDQASDLFADRCCKQLVSDPSVHSTTVQKQDASPSLFSKLLKSIGLDAFYLLNQDKVDEQTPAKENPKILIHRDLRAVCYLSLLHSVPVTASIILVVLNCRGFYIGGELQGAEGKDDLKILGLQFAAKILELLAVASLSTIMLALVRDQLISDSLPFGAVTAGYEFNKLSILWSKGFVATCVASFTSVRQKTLLIATVIVFTILSTTIGPSAAVSALPELRDWPAGGTTFYLNATSQDLWPTVLTETAASDIPCSAFENASCFPSSYDSLAETLLSLWPRFTHLEPDRGDVSSVMPEKATVMARRSAHVMEVRFKGPFLYQPELTAATTPLGAVSDAASQLARYWFSANARQCSAGIARFCFYKDLSSSIKAAQPVTYVRCSGSNITQPLQFPKVDQAAGSYPVFEYQNRTYGSQRWFDQSTNNSLTASLDWIDLPEAQHGSTSLGAVIALPGDRASDQPDQAISCTIDARWAPSNATVSFLGGPDLVSGSPREFFLQAGRLRRRSDGQLEWPRIKVASAWAEAMNPSIPGSSRSVFERLCNSVGRLNNISLAPSPESAVEAVLAIMVTENLARTQSSAAILGSLRNLAKQGWVNNILPHRTVFGYGTSAFDYSYSIGDRATEFSMRATVLGYGYGITTARLLSTIVLLVYSLIVMIYVFHTICYTQATSDAWESITDLMALAINSTPSSRLKNTGAGIGSLGVLKEPVRVRVNDRRLQMVFENESNGQKVECNEHYG